MMLFASAAWLFAGFTALADGMMRHSSQMTHRRIEPVVLRRFRIAGWVLLAAALGLALCGDHGWALGLMAWLGLVPVTAGVLLLGLTYAPMRLRLAGIGAFSIGLVGILLQ